MEYSFVYNGRGYELPKKTLDVTKNLNEILNIDGANISIEKKFQRCLEFVTVLVGKDNVIELFGSDELRKIDLSELSIVINLIDESYGKPLEEFQARRMNEKLSSIPIESLSALMETVVNAEKSAK